MTSITDLPIEVLDTIMRMVMTSCPADAPPSVAFAPRAVCRLWKHVYDRIEEEHGMQLTWFSTVNRAPPGAFRVVIRNPRPSQIQMIGPERCVAVIDVWMLASILDEIVALKPAYIIVDGKRIPI